MTLYGEVGAQASFRVNMGSILVSEVWNIEEFTAHSMYSQARGVYYNWQTCDATILHQDTREFQPHSQAFPASVCSSLGSMHAC